MSKEPFPCTTITSLKHSLQVKLEEYKAALEEVRETGTVGSVERLRVIEAELTSIKTEIEEELNKAGYSLEEENTSKLSVDYEHPDGEVENITFDLEFIIHDFQSFFVDHDLEVPPDFAPKIREIFNNNQIKIREQIKTKGFNKMLVVPGNLSLRYVMRRMEQDKGTLIWFNDDTDFFSAVIEPPHTQKHRLILVHDAGELSDREELASTLDITNTDALLHNPLSLVDYLIFARHHKNQTGKQLDAYLGTWTSSILDAGILCVSFFDSGEKLSIHINRISLGLAYSPVGVRPSAVFT